MNEADLGKALQKARQAAKLTQQELCHKAGLSYSTLAKIERGAIKSPSIFTIQNIAEALGLTLNELLIDVAPKKTAKDTKRRSKNGVRFVYFDINGCLVRFFHRAFTQIAEESGKQADVIETLFWHYNDAVCSGEIPVEEFNQILGEQLEIKDFDWRNYYLEAIDPITEMSELLAWVSQNYYIGLLSNIMPGLIEVMMDKGTIPALAYDAIIDSSDVGAIKPEERIYEIAQSKAGVAAEEILLVDDARANLMAAERMGWKVLWFDDYRPDESIERIRSALEYEK